jgi:hypothetical protein
MEQPLALANARIKLRQHQLWQWDTLASTQIKVWLLIIEETTQKLSSHTDDKLACLGLERSQCARH